MKTSTTYLALALGAVNAVFARAIIKRADTSETCVVGYATQNGGTTGGVGGISTKVSSFSELKACASQGEPAICIVSGTISGADTVKIASDKTILGADSSAKLDGIGLTIKGVKNVIVRNLAINKVLAVHGDAIGIKNATNVWIDHLDVQGDLTQPDKDLYDGLIDVSHASDWISLTNNHIHNHWKASLVGHSDTNGAEDTGHLTVTYANNYFSDLASRGPSYRFGTGHIFNNYYEKIHDAINTRLGAQLLVESNVFVDVDKPLFSVEKDGFAVANGNDFGRGANTAPVGTLKSVPYKYKLLGCAKVKAAVVGTAGNTLSF